MSGALNCALNMDRYEVVRQDSPQVTLESSRRRRYHVSFAGTSIHRLQIDPEYWYLRTRWCQNLESDGQHSHNKSPKCSTQKYRSARHQIGAKDDGDVSRSLARRPSVELCFFLLGSSWKPFGIRVLKRSETEMINSPELLYIS